MMSMNIKDFDLKNLEGHPELDSGSHMYQCNLLGVPELNSG